MMCTSQSIDYVEMMRAIEQVMSSRHNRTLLNLLGIPEYLVLTSGAPPNMGALWSVLETSDKFNRMHVHEMKNALANLGDDAVSREMLNLFDSYEKKYLGHVKFDLGMQERPVENRRFS